MVKLTMTSHGRFDAVCQHKFPDRIPIDYLATPQVDMELKKYYGLKTEDELLERLGCDFYYLSCRDISQNESCFPFYKGPKLNISSSERVCPFGICYSRSAFDSKFAVDKAIRGPLEEAKTAKDILSHPWPKVDWFDFEPLISECEAHADKVIIGGMWSGILGDSYRIHGFQNFLTNMALNPDLIKTLVNCVTDFYLELNEHIFSTLRGKIDIWFFGNDFGSQEGLLFSEQMFCEFFFDNIKRLTTLAHGYGLKVMMHSCGAISSIIPLLIKAGVDILDPIQVTAKGMLPAELKVRIGNDIIFHGGIDVQQVLPNGSKQQIYEHVCETIKVLGEQGGYIFAPSQLLQSDIPIESIDVMYKAARNYNLKKLDEQ